MGKRVYFGIEFYDKITVKYFAVVENGKHNFPNNYIAAGFSVTRYGGYFGFMTCFDQQGICVKVSV